MIVVASLAESLLVFDSPPPATGAVLVTMVLKMFPGMASCLTMNPTSLTTWLSITLPVARSKRVTDDPHQSLAQNDVPRPAADDVLLAADEAYINAFMHSGDIEGEVDVRAEVRAGRVLVEISDGGCGFELGSVDVWSRPDPFKTHGRGLFLIHHLMDDVKVRPGDAHGRGTCVRMVKDFQPRSSPAAPATT